PAQSMMKYAIRHPAYPVEALGGLLFVYMGPTDKKPLLPRWDVLVWQDGQRTIRLQETLECNWLQAQENSADVTHTYFLHAHTLKLRGQQGGDYFYRPFEQYGFQPFEFGLIKTWRYASDGRLGAEVGGGNPLIFPNMLRQQSGPWHNMHFRVPERNQTIELPGWFLMESDGVQGLRGSSRDLVGGAELLDERHQVFDVPFGAARPAGSRS